MSTLAQLPMENPFAPVARAAPRRGTLTLLVLLVLGAHLLVLRTAPKRFGPTPDPAAQRAPVFATRSIKPPSATKAAAPAVAAAAAASVEKPVVKPVKKSVFKQNKAVVQEVPTLPAIDFVAPQTIEPPGSIPPVAEEPALSAEPNSGPASSTAALAAPAADAASAATGTPVPPPGPRQTLVTDIKLPESARLDYKVTGGAKGLTYHANAELNWNNAGGDYEARMTVSALFIGSRSMASRGKIVGEGLAPSRFADKYKSEVAAHFEPDKGQVSFSANTPATPWIKGMQDRVSVFFQLAGMLAGNPNGFPVGATISMVTVGPRDADGWTFLVEAGEKLSLPFGELDTLKLSRQPRKEFDQKVEIWYAPSLGYLPVRSKITQSNGDFVDQQLKTVGKPPQ
ncbi:DUF3108 domain-containing protein [Polaromonas sp.]|uniref:DUF3108 domain-containing protein n=1 Tax=Polaromonas sp. TaxID=1869339 RepID=UPI0025D3A9F8|nr:DUF3108 domain-containing protein [Polaromonas sp.]